MPKYNYIYKEENYMSMTLVHFDTATEIDKNTILGLAKRIRSVFGEDVIGKEIAFHQKISDNKHSYELKLIKDFLTEDEIEVLVSIFYHQIPVDFDIEFETEVPEPQEPDVEEVVVFSESAQHEMWVSTQLKEGWSYGVEFCKETKTNPLLRPFYQLTERQKKKLRESNE